MKKRAYRPAEDGNGLVREVIPDNSADVIFPEDICIHKLADIFPKAGPPRKAEKEI
jgi:hypothetical protein